MRTRLVPVAAIAAATVALAAPVLAADDAGTAPQESWTGDSEPEQRRQVDQNPEAATVQHPAAKAPAGTPDAPDVGAAPQGPDDLEEEVEEVNEATERRKERMVEASPRLGTERLVDLVGRDVYSADGEQVGEVSDILATSEGTPAWAVVNGDGFLTLDGGQMKVQLSDLEVRDGRLVVPMDYEQVSDLMGKDGPFSD